MSFQLNEKPIIKKVFDRIPHTEVQLIVQGFPLIYLQRYIVQFTEKDHTHLA